MTAPDLGAPYVSPFPRRLPAQCPSCLRWQLLSEPFVCTNTACGYTYLGDLSARSRKDAPAQQGT